MFLVYSRHLSFDGRLLAREPERPAGLSANQEDVGQAAALRKLKLLLGKHQHLHQQQIQRNLRKLIISYFLPKVSAHELDLPVCLYELFKSNI
jgi:hypothetical protein